MIKVKLGLGDRVYARQCKIVDVSSKDRVKFFKENHLMGDVSGVVTIGLELNSEILMVMAFSKPRYNKTYSWELIRMCSKLNTVIVGGMSKILSHFCKIHGKSLITYSDVRLSGFEPSYKNSFKFIAKNSPGFFVEYKGEIKSRSFIMKHKLLARHSDYDHSLSAIENAIKFNYNIVYDCGQWVYALDEAQV